MRFVVLLLGLLLVCGSAGAVTGYFPQGDPVLQRNAAPALSGTGPVREPQTDKSPAMDGVIISLRQVVDINYGSLSAYPEYLTRYNHDLYFGANGSGGAGTELWKYNTTYGAMRVTDIWPGPRGSNPRYLAVYNNALFFQANGNDGTGFELWRYDPVNGPLRAADINPGANNSYPSYLVVYGDWLYFGADGNNGNGTELWRYNPSYGAQPAADIRPGIASSYPVYLAVYNGVLYFNAFADDGTGYELWKYDTVHGASRVEDIYPGTPGSYPSYLTVYNGALYFCAQGNAETGYELWKYDTVHGAQMVTEIYDGFGSSSPQHMAVYNGALYFGAEGDDRWVGRELWKYDPVNGADRVADINPAGSSFVKYPAVYNGALYFNANGNNGAGDELWRYSNSVTASFRSVKAQDGWVLESGENTNAGGTVNTGAVTFNLGDDASNRQYRSVLSFDTSTLPDTAVITSAILKIRREGLVGTNPFTTHGNIRADIRNGSFSGNSSLQAVDFQAAATGSDIGTITNSPDPNNWYSSTFTSTSYRAVNKKGLTQVRLRFATDDNNDTGPDYLRFFSGNALTLSDRPQLQLTYYIP